MPFTRIVLLLVIGGGLVLFTLSNVSPVLPLVFLGTKTIPLPLAVWIGGAIAAGVCTSLVLQFLSYLQKGYPTQTRLEPNENPRHRSSFRRQQPPEIAEPEPQTQYAPPPPPLETPPTPIGSDWEERRSENWDFQEPPTTPTSKAQEFRDWQRQSSASAFQETSQSEEKSYEVPPQEPKTQSQTGSNYSYSYREVDKKDLGVGKPDAIYDANYRVIMPPYQKPPEPPDDEEDWGFEDDEDFER